jgi:hypothetical protein
VIDTKQPRALDPLAVKLLAKRLREDLSRGYQPGDRFTTILTKLTDSELVRRYLDQAPKPQSLRPRRRAAWN